MDRGWNDTQCLERAGGTLLYRHRIGGDGHVLVRRNGALQEREVGLSLWTHQIIEPVRRGVGMLGCLWPGECVDDHQEHLGRLLGEPDGLPVAPFLPA